MPATTEATKEVTVTKGPSLLATMAERYGTTPAQMNNALLGTVLKGENGQKPTQEQYIAFMIVANQYELNPFTREIHAFIKAGSLVPIVGVDGWVRLVNRQAEYDGCDFEDIFDKNGELIAVKCSMHTRTRQHPTCITEYMSECVRPTEPWKKWPRRMLRHKAYIQAARYTFGFSGIKDPDEGDRIREAIPTDAEVVEMEMTAGTPEQHSGGFEDAPKPSDFKTNGDKRDDTSMRTYIQAAAMALSDNDQGKSAELIDDWSGHQNIHEMTGDDLTTVYDIAKAKRSEQKKK